MTDGRAPAVLWVRRDLRLADNPALQAALEHSSAVLLLYVHAPEEEGDWAPGGASRWWLHHSLEAFDASLRSRGNRLILRRGPTLATLLDTVREVGADAVFWNRLYEPAVVARDTLVEQALGASGLQAHSCNAALLLEPWQLATAQGSPYRVFTPFWRSLQRTLDTLPSPLPAPRRIPAPTRSPASMPLESLELLPRHRWDAGLAERWQAGEERARRRLEVFCDEALPAYEDGRNRPDLDATSRLSPHLHFGEVSPRQCLAAVRLAIDGRQSPLPAAECFLRQLGWREFAHHLLFHFPHTTDAALDARFERFPWDRSPELLESWQRGRTGYPIVDAGMRELWHTGWMHNRVRMIVASFLSKNLLRHWRDGARWFWDTLVDADLASNTLGWQWTAGCGADAAPYFRVFNPTLQSERHDPARNYLRRWLPELAGLPEPWLHRPSDAPAGVLAAAGVELGRDYPRPVVDFRASRERALATYASVRSGLP